LSSFPTNSNTEATEERSPKSFDYNNLVQQYGSPLLILDKAAVRKQYRDLVKALPDVQLHYAIKPLPHEGVI
jgi:ornithine decarboxylase